MGATTADIFGGAGNAQPADPHTYGEAPSRYRLPDATRLGPVRLQVSDLERSVAFYSRTLGMRVVSTDGGVTLLAAHGDDRPLVELNEREGAKSVPRRGRLGLYHFAILLPDRAALGRFVQHLGEIGTQAGAADHLVSEAFYLQDPDNMGIEIYADRPRSQWRRVGRELMMATDPVDITGIVASAGKERWTGMPKGTIMGHVHLHVGDIDEASRFFSETLGFDRIVWHYPGALFLSAGGYHHHLGTNTWAGSGAQAPADDEARLLEWTIELPAEADVVALADQLSSAGWSAEPSGAGDRSQFVTRDPWGTQIRVTTGA